MKTLEISQIKNAIEFSNSFENQARMNFTNLLMFLLNFAEIFDREKVELPYHINLIDELHADENAHSRIFAKLLRYKKNDKYPFLEKFLKDVCNFDVTIENPKVKNVDSCGRIDIPIFDKKYVVVIENKVTDQAPDQNKESGGQLARYIETIHHKYKKELKEIFVVYTPKNTREPSDECWINKDNHSYKDDFKERFRSLSYRDVIYPWLKNKILPNIDEKNIYIRSALEQYVDHLEGEKMFNLRNKKMNMELQKFIKKELGLQESNPKGAFEILSEKETELNNAISQIQQLKSKYQKQIVENHFEEWKKSLQTKFPNLKIVGDKFKIDKMIINIGVEFSIENQSFAGLIECNNCYKPNIFFGVSKHFVSKTKHKTPERLQKILNDSDLVKTDEFWYGWKYTSLENAYMRLITLIEEIEKKIK